MWDRSQSSVEAGGLFSNMVDFQGHRHHEFLIRFLIGWNLWRPSWIWKTIESIVLQTIAYCLSRLLIGYGPYKPGIVVTTIKEELNSEYVLNFSTWSSLRHSRQPLHHDPSAFCRVILGGKCAQAAIERDRSRLAKDTVPFDIRKFRKVKRNFLVEWNAPKFSSALAKFHLRSWFILMTTYSALP